VYYISWHKGLAPVALALLIISWIPWPYLYTEGHSAPLNAEALVALPFALQTLALPLPFLLPSLTSH